MDMVEFNQLFVQNFNKDLSETTWEMSAKASFLKREQGYYPSPSYAGPLRKPIFKTPDQCLRTSRVTFKYTTLIEEGGARGQPCRLPKIKGK